MDPTSRVKQRKSGVMKRFQKDSCFQDVSNNQPKLEQVRKLQERNPQKVQLIESLMCLDTIRGRSRQLRWD